MKQIISLTTLFIFISIITGCNSVTKSSIDKSPFSKNKYSSGLIPIKHGVKITVKETHSPTDLYNAAVRPHIQLTITTKDVFSCLGYGIVSDLKRSKMKLEVEIYGVQKPKGLCAAALGPAVASYKLNLTPGEYTLSFIYEKVEQIQLTVTHSSLKITAGETSFIDPETKTFWRYPEKSFAYLCSYIQETQHYCGELEQVLIDSLNIASFTFPKHGIIPYPVTDDHHDQAIYYYYQDKTAYEKAGAILNAFADSMNIDNRDSNVYLSVINWKNRGFYTWTEIDNEDEGCKDPDGCVSI